MQLALFETLSSGEVGAALALIACAATVVCYAIFNYMEVSTAEQQEEELAKLAARARGAAGQAGFEPKDVFRLEGKEWSATGYGTVSGFVVCKGSIVRKEAFSSLTDKLHNLRQSFVDNAILVDETDGDELVLRTDFEFDSSTAAASFVTGRKASGPYNWKDDNGLTFGEYTSQSIPKA
jgi:hypothetical protein